MKTYPKLRTHTRKGKGANSQKSTVHYYYDMRGFGSKDIPLGSDKDVAIERWHILRSGGSIDDFVKHPKPEKEKFMYIRIPKTLPPPRKGEVRVFKGLEWFGMPDWARNMYLGAETRSKKRGFAEFMTLYFFRELVQKANGKCQISGLDLVYEKGGRNPFSPSIDRIDSSKGYVEGNVRIVCLIVNLGMSEWGSEPYLKVCNAIAAKQNNKTVGI